MDSGAEVAVGTRAGAGEPGPLLMKRWRLCGHSQANTPESPVTGSPYPVVSFTLWAFTRFSQRTSGKNSLVLTAGGGKRNGLNMPEHSILSNVCPQEKLFDQNLLGLYQSLTDPKEGKYPTVAPL